jgi:hypothetical protein
MSVDLCTPKHSYVDYLLKHLSTQVVTCKHAAHMCHSVLEYKLCQLQLKSPISSYYNCDKFLVIIRIQCNCILMATLLQTLSNTKSAELNIQIDPVSCPWQLPGVRCWSWWGNPVMSWHTQYQAQPVSPRVLAFRCPMAGQLKTSNISNFLVLQSPVILSKRLSSNCTF